MVAVTFRCTYRYRQPLYGTEQYHYGIVGTDGVTVTPGGREYEQFIIEIRLFSVKKLQRIIINRRIMWHVVQLILFNHENAWSIERQNQNATWNTMAHIEKYHRTLKSFGAPVDFITEEKDFKLLSGHD